MSQRAPGRVAICFRPILSVYYYRSTTSVHQIAYAEA